jgi:fluoroquinolone resistance protein
MEDTTQTAGDGPGVSDRENLEASNKRMNQPLIAGLAVGLVLLALALTHIGLVIQRHLLSPRIAPSLSASAEHQSHSGGHDHAVFSAKVLRYDGWQRLLAKGNRHFARLAGGVMMEETHETPGRKLPLFADAYYEDRCFTGIAFRGTELHAIEFFHCRFDGCQFPETTFRQCCFEQCVFEKCDLSVMRPLGSRFTDVRFVKSKLLGIDWTLAATPASLAFQGGNVSHSMFQGLALPKLELTECIAREVDFTGANLTKASLARTDFLGSRFVDTNLSGADFTHAVNYAIDPTANRLKKAVFSLPEAMSLLSAFDIVLK